MKIIIFDAGRRNHIQTGYGMMSHQFGARLANRGFEIYYYDEHVFPEQVDIWLWIRPPHYIEYTEFDKNNYNVFFTMCEQETFEGRKANWPTLLNKCNAVITPTKWNKEVFEKNGVTVPIYNCRLGVDPKIFKGHKTYEFSILSVFENLGGNAREDWRQNIEAYYDLFYDNTEVTYTIKSWSVNYEKYRAFLRELIAKKSYDASKLPAINIVDLALVATDMNELYSKHWVFLKNTRGEGWCLTGLEALSAGLPIIATKLPAMEYLNETNCAFFKGYDQLKIAILKEWREHQKKRKEMNFYTWKEATVELDKILKVIHG